MNASKIYEVLPQIGVRTYRCREIKNLVDFEEHVVIRITWHFCVHLKSDFCSGLHEFLDVLVKVEGIRMVVIDTKNDLLHLLKVSVVVVALLELLDETAVLVHDSELLLDEVFPIALPLGHRIQQLLLDNLYVILILPMGRRLTVGDFGSKESRVRLLPVEVGSKLALDLGEVLDVILHIEGCQVERHTPELLAQILDDIYVLLIDFNLILHFLKEIGSSLFVGFRRLNVQAKVNTLPHPSNSRFLFDLLFSIDIRISNPISFVSCSVLEFVSAVFETINRLTKFFYCILSIVQFLLELVLRLRLALADFRAGGRLRERSLDVNLLLQQSVMVFLRWLGDEAVDMHLSYKM